jgi:hypothetical protein
MGQQLPLGKCGPLFFAVRNDLRGARTVRASWFEQNSLDEKCVGVIGHRKVASLFFHPLCNFAVQLADPARFAGEVERPAGPALLKSRKLEGIFALLQSQEHLDFSR